MRRDSVAITLVILAAGMGSRFGGAKQIEPVGPNGELLIDYSVIDAVRAGFDKVVFIIRKEIEEVFMDTVYRRASKLCECVCVYQERDDLPVGYAFPEGRVKPWGTGHAALAARHAVNEPFAVINADDFYGRGAFAALAGFLRPIAETGVEGEYCMVGYKLENTLSEHGSVSRGVCNANAAGYLESITERKKIYITKDGNAVYSENGEEHALPLDAVVSMNCFGFTPDFFREGWRLFGEFLLNIKDKNTGELQLPWIPNTLIEEGRAAVKLIGCDEKWYGFTYREDRETVVKALRELTDRGVY